MAENKSFPVYLYVRCLFRSWRLFLVCLGVGWWGGGSKILTMLIASFGKFVYHLWFDKLNEIGVFTVLSYAQKKCFHMLRKKRVNKHVR